MTPDLINSLFELFGSITLWLNVKQLVKDKCYNGVTTLATGFFMTWGYWNLYYYPSLNQWLSFTGGISIALANTACLILMLYYGKGK